MNLHAGQRTLQARDPQLAPAPSWSESAADGLRRSRNLAWVIASIAAAGAVLQAVALVLLLPLKTTVPYAFVVDRQTGYVQAAARLEPGLYTQSAAITQSNLVRYVLARETFDGTDLRENYRRTATWSAGRARDAYIRQMKPENPDSPLRIYPRDALVRVTIKSVSLLGANSALVRFDATREDAAGPGKPVAYAAVVGFRYTTSAKSLAERFDNPLGFEVVSYRRDRESLPQIPGAPA